MSTLKKAFALMGISAVLLPSFAFAATGTGSRVFEGNGAVTGKGFGLVTFEGRGKISVTGTGTLTVSKDANVNIKGVGEKTISGDVITYTGFDGTAVVSGKDVTGSLSGDVKSFKASGKGKVTVKGEGTVSKRAWFAPIVNKEKDTKQK